ncbi:DUF1963 domain-containing protein [Actinopolyspora halophila]|uniref:DUF1963 domain-containing protein n=1 Tax=Actinopolyspora halophila TaxID=1850 RepID=UPI00036D0492|nr:DUF1963 domain-containing protein [Actinopolyspora halophila]
MIAPEQRREHMTQNLAHHMGTSLAERITAFAHTGVKMCSNSDIGEPLGLSRFGGDALLPPGTGWPYDYKLPEIPLELAMVVDLTVVGPMHPDGLLPHHGVLNFFARSDYGGAKVIHADPATAVTTSPPEGTKRHAEEALNGRTVLTAPGDEDLERLAPDLAQELEDLYSSGRIAEDYTHKSIAESDSGDPEKDERFFSHLMGGLPNWQQSTMFHGPEKVHLLLELRGGNRHFDFGGPSNSLYIVIKEQNLRAGDFDKAYGITQCV